MIDICERLERNPGPYVCIRREAAAEIRSLRKALKLAQWRFKEIALKHPEARAYAEAIALEMGNLT